MIKKSNYYICYENICRKFAEYAPQEMVLKSGTQYDKEKKQFTLLYLNKEYIISYPKGRISLKHIKEDTLLEEDSISIDDKLMIIHYLYEATNSLP
jgi:hypothetical protein